MSLVGEKRGSLRRVEHGRFSPSYGHTPDSVDWRHRQDDCRARLPGLSLGAAPRQQARIALYRAASTGRAAEPRLAGSRGSRPVAIAPPDHDASVAMPMSATTVMSVARCSAGQGQALRVTAEGEASLDSTMRAVLSGTARPGREKQSRTIKKMDFAGLVARFRLADQGQCKRRGSLHTLCTSGAYASVGLSNEPHDLVAGFDPAGCIQQANTSTTPWMTILKGSQSCAVGMPRVRVTYSRLWHAPRERRLADPRSQGVGCRLTHEVLASNTMTFVADHARF